MSCELIERRDYHNVVKKWIFRQYFIMEDDDYEKIDIDLLDKMMFFVVVKLLPFVFDED